MNNANEIDSLKEKIISYDITLKEKEQEYNILKDDH